jgi:HNH endonuclease
MAQYGELYRVTDFIRRTISSKNFEFSIEVMQFLKTLDAIQRQNPSFTLVIHTGDGIWVTYQGQKLLFLKPAQRFLNLHLFEPVSSTNAKAKLTKFIKHQNRMRNLFGESQKGSSWNSWRVFSKELRALTKFLRALPSVTGSKNKIARHPRNIPGVVRQAVLDQFQKNGSVCPGVDGKTKSHKVAQDQGFEFDHIFPYAKRGASTLANVQVLCMDCNRLKRATAL